HRRPPLVRDRPRHRGSPRVPGADQGDGHQGEPGRRVREVAGRPAGKGLCRTREGEGLEVDPDGPPACCFAEEPGYHQTLMRRYFVTTFGCQMNAHDSERIKGTLESLGLGEAPTREQADVL